MSAHQELLRQLEPDVEEEDSSRERPARLMGLAPNNLLIMRCLTPIDKDAHIYIYH